VEGWLSGGALGETEGPVCTYGMGEAGGTPYSVICTYVPNT
jgi:hypothetical protein